MKRLILILLAFSTLTLCADDLKKFHMKDSSVVIGKITVEAPDKHYIVQTDNGSKIKIRKNDIIKITTAVEQFKRTYPELGGTLILPGGLNVNLGYTFEDFGIMLTGGPLGIEFAGAFKLGHSQRISHEIILPMGYTNIDYKEWLYTGALYKLWLSGFQLMGGLMIGEGDYSNPQLYIQIGYIYRFN